MTDQPPPNVHKANQLNYRDRAEVSETYADVLRVICLEGGNVRMEFVVNRPDPPSAPDATITGTSVTACRLVMPVQGVLDMKAKLDDLLVKLRAAGVIRSISAGPVGIN